MIASAEASDTMAASLDVCEMAGSSRGITASDATFFVRLIEATSRTGAVGLCENLKAMGSATNRSAVPRAIFVVNEIDDVFIRTSHLLKRISRLLTRTAKILVCFKMIDAPPQPRGGASFN